MSSQREEIFVKTQVEYQQLYYQYTFSQSPLGKGSFAQVVKATNKHDPSIMTAVKMVNKSSHENDEKKQL